MITVECPRCHTRVLPLSDGLCPACRQHKWSPDDPSFPSAPKQVRGDRGSGECSGKERPKRAESGPAAFPAPGTEPLCDLCEERKGSPRIMRITSVRYYGFWRRIRTFNFHVNCCEMCAEKFRMTGTRLLGGCLGLIALALVWTVLALTLIHFAPPRPKEPGQITRAGTLFLIVAVAAIVGSCWVPFLVIRVIVSRATESILTYTLVERLEQATGVQKWGLCHLELRQTVLPWEAIHSLPAPASRPWK